MSFSKPIVLLYKNSISRLQVSVHLDYYADFEDEEKVLKALETLYLRGIYYNEQAGYKPTPWWRKTFWPCRSEKALFTAIRLAHPPGLYIFGRALVALLVLVIEPEGVQS